MGLAPEGQAWKVIGLFSATAIFTNFLEGYSTSYPNTAADSFHDVSRWLGVVGELERSATRLTLLVHQRLLCKAQQRWTWVEYMGIYMVLEHVPQHMVRRFPLRHSRHTLRY